MMASTDLAAQLEQWRKMKDADFEERLFWETDNPPPPIILQCANCGMTEEWRVSWDEIARAISDGRGLVLTRRECPQCSPDDDD